MSKKKAITDVKVKGKFVLLRVDWNVPQNEVGEVVDDKRIRESLETINYLRDNGAKTIIVSHLGRPKGEVKVQFSLKPILKRVREMLPKVKIFFALNFNEAREFKKRLKPGEIVVLENIRFFSGEEKNSPEFAKKLAELGEICVNDAFGTIHREHASIVGVSNYIPIVAGLLVQREIEKLQNVRDTPDRPYFLLLGGAKFGDKVQLIEGMLKKVDKIFVFGGISYSFIKAMGYEIGKSICSEQSIEVARGLLEKIKAQGVKFLLPEDITVAKEFHNDAERKVVGFDEIPQDWEGMDIGPKTINKFKLELKEAKTVFWNGTMGVVEFPNFTQGTFAMAEFLASLPANVVVGGGDTVAVLEKIGLAEKMAYCSTGGGSALKYLGGETLPGIVCIADK